MGLWIVFFWWWRWRVQHVGENEYCWRLASIRVARGSSCYLDFIQDFIWDFNLCSGLHKWPAETQEVQPICIFTILYIFVFFNFFFSIFSVFFFKLNERRIERLKNLLVHLVRNMHNQRIGSFVSLGLLALFCVPLAWKVYSFSQIPDQCFCIVCYGYVCVALLCFKYTDTPAQRLLLVWLTTEHDS